MSLVQCDEEWSSNDSVSEKTLQSVESVCCFFYFYSIFEPTDPLAYAWVLSIVGPELKVICQGPRCKMRLLHEYRVWRPISTD